MPINVQPKNGFLKPVEDRKKSSKQNSRSRIAKESSVLPESGRRAKDADKLKSKSGVSSHRQQSDLKQKAKQDSEGKIQSCETVKRSATERDELVKHMSNLPRYLLHNDRVENSQEKAFNVGVLDWSRLEKWKHKNKPIPVLASNYASLYSSESSSRTANSLSTGVGGKEKLDNKRGLLSSGIRPTHRECPPQSSKLHFQNVKRFESSKSGAKSIGDQQRTTPWPFESFGKTHSDVSLEKERRNDYNIRTSQVGNFESNLRHHGISRVSNEKLNGRDYEAKTNTEVLLEYHKKRERNHKSSFDIGQPSVESKGKGASFSSKKMSSSSSDTRKRLDRFPESGVEVGHQHCHSKPSNIVLLYPQELPQSSSSEDFRHSELRTSSDENFSESSRSSLSYVSLPEEDYTDDGCSEVPHSSSLNSAFELSSSETMQHSTGTSSVVSETPPSIMNKICRLQSVDACFEKDALDTELRNRRAFGNLTESLDQETAELTAQKGMNPSHNRRFSFSLSRIGRSLSFKEGPTLPQFSSMHVSAKSGPVTPQASARWDNPSKEKASCHSRARSSPLRRLLDPILKHKASSNTHHSVETSQTQKGSMNSISFRTTSVNESSLQAEKSKGSSLNGLLQLTVKNELPLFKFVLNNEKKIFAAMRNSLTSPEKDDSGCCYSFYVVNEIKKKSGGWISHGSKEKSCGYAYNIVAQMKFSSSKITEPIGHNSKRQRMVKEHVLVGVEIGQTDKGPPKFIQSKELAAIVIETPCENSINEGIMHGDNNLIKKGCFKCLADERCLCSSRENDISSSTTVILPGGVHSLPNKGEPTPLIYRWRTGGSCDCGGWDIGCKLLVLSNQKQGSNNTKCSKPYHDRFQLFAQEGAEQDTPFFTLLPLKDGFYSVEFNSTITPLQAFFISVAVLSCHKLPGSLEMGGMHEEIFKEPISMNNNRLQQGKTPLKYTPLPPLSPVGRV